MEDVETVNFFRENSRNLLKITRRLHRDEESDSRRTIIESSITSEDIANIASKLKTKSPVTVADLQTLKNGLASDTKHIQVFLSEHGALRGLVRELTGQNVDKQCLAAKCCCNLALGDAKACFTVAKATGSYLVAALDNLAVDLAVACAWALGNLAVGGRARGVLAAQGAVARLSAPRADVRTQDAALYALLHFTAHMADDLKSEHLRKILHTVSKQNLTTNSAHLLFILSCHEHFTDYVTEELQEKLLKDLSSALETQHKQSKVCYKLVYIVRTLANSNTMYGLTLNYCVSSNIFENFKSVLSINNSVLNNSLLWWLGNLYMYCNDDFLFLKIFA